MPCSRHQAFLPASGIAAVVITACKRAAAVHARPRAGMDSTSSRQRCSVSVPTPTSQATNSTAALSGGNTFGAEPAKIHPELIEILRTQIVTQGDEPARLFSQGDRVQIKEGPLAGLQVVYQMADGECRAMVLIEILGKLSKLTLEPANLREV